MFANCRASVITVLTATACATAIAGCDTEQASEVLPLKSPTSHNSGTPHLSVQADGKVVLSWLELDHDEATLQFSVLDDGQWSTASTVASGDNWFVNWADFPSVEPITESLWAAHWLTKRMGGPYAYDVTVAVSTDGGINWSDPQLAHDDGTATEHGFVSLFPWQSGAGAVWLDGRNMGGGHGDHHGAMTLRSAVVTANNDIVAPQLIDNRVCDCCQTDVALIDDNPAVVYRDRSAEEIRDIYFARSKDGQWLDPQRVGNDGWEISACPVNGPAIATNGNNVAIAWFTAANDEPRVRMVYSRDSGETFSPVLDIDSNSPLGRVDVAVESDGTSYVSWLRGSAQQGEILVREISATGELYTERQVTTVSTARSSGFPQMVISENRIVFAWTEVGEESSRVLTAYLAL